MEQCHTCGNKYLNCFKVILNNETYLFDSFECAIHALAPSCAHCGCKVIGHGIAGAGATFCCAHCAKASGIADVSDRSADSVEHDLEKHGRENLSPT